MAGGSLQIVANPQLPEAAPSWSLATPYPHELQALPPAAPAFAAFAAW